MNIWGISDTGAVRKENQDAYYITSATADTPFAIVCDGMGGARAGNVASQLAVDSFVQKVIEQLEAGSSDYPKILQEGVASANEIVCYRAAIDPDCIGMGTTLVAALIVEHTVHLVNVGDSRAYLVGEEGIEKLTRDHSVVEDLVVRGEITTEQARLHPQKNLITRALGAEPNVQADLYGVPRQAETLILLCSDGLSNVMSDQELLFELLHGGPLEECCQRLLNVALSRGAPDNVTAVLIAL